MNCQNFETVAGDLARGVPLEARAQAEARAHEASCARCAARLADERALSTGLRALAASTSGAEAPPRVEADLLAAFRARAASAGTHAAPERVSTAKVVPLARPASPKRWGWAKTLGSAAAAAAAAVTLVVLVQPRQSPTGERAGSSPQQAARVELPRLDTPRDLTPVAAAAVDDKAARVDAGGGAGMSAPRAAIARRAAPARPAAVYRNAGARAAQLAAASGAGEEEIATAFFPLTQDARFAVAEGGQVVRVELPRTALQRFGLPINVERAGGRVKADVLLGHDGVARAIRFVR